MRCVGRAYRRNWSDAPWGRRWAGGGDTSRECGAAAGRGKRVRVPGCPRQGSVCRAREVVRRRVASYWTGLGDRDHFAPMVARVQRVEAVVCASEHEAAWLERNLLEH